MSMGISLHGSEENPLLICIHGLMGGPQDFDQMLGGWERKFRVVVLDLLAEFREAGIIKLSKEDANRVTFDGATEQIHEWLTKTYPGRRAFFNGISLGGKVVYDFAAKFPELFLGGAITDVGPGLLEDSALYEFVEVTIPGINLSLPWSQLKEEIKQKIPEKNIRIMVQTQVYYPEKDGPAQWKPGMDSLQGMLSGTSIKEQWQVLESLEKGQARIILLNAAYLSGVSDEDLERIKKCSKIEVRRIPLSTHFLHITHRKEVERASLDLLKD